jgi:hypothetical protein
MIARLPRPLRIAGLLAFAFTVGGASAEVAVRTHDAIERVRAEREIGAAGQLVALRLTDQDGEVLARPRLIAPAGRAAELYLHDPAQPEVVRVAFRVEAVREPSGFISLEYTLHVPGRDLTASGRVSLTPGVEHEIELGEGEDALVATWMAVPVPSAQFDAFLEGEAGASRVVVRAT